MVLYCILEVGFRVWVLGFSLGLFYFFLLLFAHGIVLHLRLQLRQVRGAVATCTHTAGLHLVRGHTSGHAQGPRKPPSHPSSRSWEGMPLHTLHTNNVFLSSFSPRARSLYGVHAAGYDARTGPRARARALSLAQDDV